MMKAAVLAAMTAIALSSTPLLRFSSCPDVCAHRASGLSTHPASMTHPGHAALEGLSASGTVNVRSAH
jgi:hypothetical protein